MTYFLEKYFELDENGKMIPAKYMSTIIRPCNWDYDKILKFFAGKLPKNTYLVLNGQIAQFDNDYDVVNDYNCTNESHQQHNNIEEWLINLELNEGITPDFEQWHIITTGCYNDYIIKTIDLHRHETIDDRADEIIENLMKEKCL